MPVDSHREMERTPISSPESLRVRCPHCRKLYLVQFAEIQKHDPHFKCVACLERFWVSLADMDFSTELDGIPTHLKAPLRAKAAVIAVEDPCPKCFKLTPRHISECVHCGVVISKLKDMSFKEAMPAHSSSLELLWHKVISAYDMSAVHDEFVRACHADNNLSYAAALYSQMIKLMPMDEISLNRMKQVKALSEIEMPAVRESAPLLKPGARLWQLPLISGVICIAVGLSLPTFRNIAGVGAALLFLAVAIRKR